MRPARALAEELLLRVRASGRPALLMLAHWALGFPCYEMGDLLLAREQFEMAISLYRERQLPPALRMIGGIDNEVQSLAFLAYTLWTLGYPEQAIKRVNEAIELARAMSHPFSLAFAEQNAAGLCLFRGAGRAAQAQAETVITLCAEHGITEISTYATILIGAAVVKEGLFEEGIAQIQTGLAGLEATGSGLARPFYLGYLAAAYLGIGRLDDASSTLAQAFICADENSDRQHEAELYRLKAELILAQENSNKAQAQNWLQHAVESARRQSAKSLELRATVSLASLLRDTGRREEARTMLAEIYQWFTEGFDTADLRDGKALLDELSA